MGLTKEEAIKMADSKWWEGKTDEEIAEFQMHEERLCCPFEVFHKAVETWLDRPVWTHELADLGALIAEKEGKREFEGAVKSLQRMAPGKPIVVVETD